MSFLGLSGWEPIVLLVLFLVIIGPQRLPEYTRNIVRWVRQARRWVEDSRSTVEDEMGIAIDDLRKYDPRQYDPRRIIREAWGDTSVEDLLPSEEALTVAAGGKAKSGAKPGSAKSSAAKAGGKKAKKDEGPQRAPFDPEAT
ncbi:translocase [Brachybacterium sp. DNPG3]